MKIFNKFLLGFIGLAMAGSVHASDLRMELVNEPWDAFHGGETKVLEINIINDTGKELEGEALLTAWYGNEMFLGTLNAINPTLELSNENSDWINGVVTFSDFKIVKGESQTSLKIKTHSALRPGNYSFSLLLKGEASNGETIVVSSSGGGGGGYFNTTPQVDPISKPVIPLTPIVSEITSPEALELIKQEIQKQSPDILHDVTDEELESYVQKIVDDAPIENLIEEEPRFNWYLVLIIILIICYIVYRFKDNIKKYL